MAEQDIEFTIYTNSDNAKKGFKEAEVSAKDLQDRIDYLSKQMRDLEANYGKSGMASKEYAMYQRELKFATDQLINTEETHNEKTKQSVRGLGSLASASTAALGSISGLGTGISVLTNALMSGAGLTAGLAGITIAFSLLMETIRSANEETEKFNKAVKDLIDVELPGGGFKIAPENLQNTIDYLDQQIKQKQLFFNQQISSGGLGMGTVPNDDKVLASFKSMKATLEEINKEYKTQQEIITALSSAGLLYSGEAEDGTDKVKKSIDKTTDAWKLAEKAVDDYIKKLVTALELQMKGEEKMLKESNRIKNSLTITQKVGKKPGIGFSDSDVMQDFYDENSFFIEQMRSDLMILQGEFNGFWENTFGEANSLLEKFLQNFAAGLLELGAKSLLSSFLDFIPGGGFLKPFIEGKQGNPQPIVLAMDGQTMATWYVGGKSQATRLRLE